MTFRTHAAPLMLALTMATLPALAQADSLYHTAPGEVGFTEHRDHWQSTKTRAQVQADIETARKDGSLALLMRGFPLPPKASGPAKTRQQVVAEVLNEPADQRRARLELLAGG